MPLNRPPPAFEMSEMVSLNALDLTVEVLELSYAWIRGQPDHCSPLCPSDNVCVTNVCRGRDCPEEPNVS